MVVWCEDLDAAAFEFVDETTLKVVFLKGLCVGVLEEYVVSELI